MVVTAAATLGGAGFALTDLLFPSEAPRRDATPTTVTTAPITHPTTALDTRPTTTVETRPTSTVETRPTMTRPRTESRSTAVKRAWNDLWLTAGLALQRGLLTDDSPVVGGHIAKGVVLAHGWPAVAAAIERNPAIVGALEEATDVDVLVETLRQAGVTLEQPDRLLRFLSMQPRLSSVFGQLTRLDPTAS